MTVERKGEVNIRGKWYRTVALRVSLFRNTFPAAGGWALLTSVAVDDGKRFLVRAEIHDPSKRCVATGHCEEIIGKGNINKTSALENAETGAIGRALAAFGLGGEEYASADEVQNAIALGRKETKKEAQVRKAKHHASWPKAHKAFMVDIAERGWEYEPLCALLELRGFQRPSLMNMQARVELLADMDCEPPEFPCGPKGRQR